MTHKRNTSASDSSVSICIASCKRAVGLKRLLAAVAAQRFRHTIAPVIEVIVVDNCTAGEACKVCDDERPEFPFKLECFVEPRPGIAHARNRAISHMSASAEFAVFIDDDETPEPYWLDELLAVQSRYGADAVAGPVLPYFSFDVPAWAKNGAFFNRPRYTTGEELEVAGTGNVLVRAHTFESTNGPFDERFALTGGEDYFFFRNFTAAGHRIVWADAAVVHEWVPASRVTVEWLLRRAHRGTNNFAQFELESRRSTAVRATMVVNGVRLVAQSLVVLPFAASLSLWDRGARVVRALQVGARGTGMIAAVFGRHYQEYRDA